MRQSSNASMENIPLLEQLGPVVRLLSKLSKFIGIFSPPPPPISPTFQFNRLSILDQDLYKIAYDVVEELNFLAARVAVLEENEKILRARAYFIHPDLLDISSDLPYQKRIEECEQKVQEIERQLSIVARKKVGLIASSACVNVNDEKARENLGVRALRAVGGPSTSRHK